MGEVDWIRKEVMKRDWDFDSIIDWKMVPLYTPVEISILAGSLWMDGDKAEKASESCRTKSLSVFLRFKRGLKNHVMSVDPTSWHQPLLFLLNACSSQSFSAIRYTVLAFHFHNGCILLKGLKPLRMTMTPPVMHFTIISFFHNLSS